MTPTAQSKFRNISEGLFQRLLVIYPKVHRAEYGPSMQQLFRDQCRDAWRDERNRGLIKLWLRVLPDLLRTSMIEHLAALKEKTMNERIHQLLRSPNAPLRIFLTAFAGVFVVVLVSSVLITFILPETYRSTARIRAGAENDTNAPYQLQTEFEVIKSDVILGKVVDDLNLKTEWGKKYNRDLLSASEAVALLRARIDLRPVRNTQLIEIRCYSEDRNEAARIANAVANVYKFHRMQLQVLAQKELLVQKGLQPVPQDQLVEIVDTAVPAKEPVRPKKALNIFLGAMMGILLGLLFGGGIGGIAFLLGRNARKNPA